MINQMQAVTGRKPRQRYTDIINASRALLPNLYAAREQRDYQDRMAGIEEDQLVLQRDRLAEEQDYARKNLKLQEEQGRKANTLGYVNLGLTGGLGYMKNKGLKDVLTSDSGGAISSGGIPSMTPGVPGGYRGFEGGTFAPTSAIPGSWTSNMGSKIGGALKSPGTYGYGGLGYAGGKLVGGKDKTKSALAGAGIGFGLNMLSGGSLTSSIISGLLGGGSAYAF